jgi:hypothetical protein
VFIEAPESFCMTLRFSRLLACLLSVTLMVQSAGAQWMPSAPRKHLPQFAFGEEALVIPLVGVLHSVVDPQTKVQVMQWASQQDNDVLQAATRIGAVGLFALAAGGFSFLSAMLGGWPGTAIQFRMGLHYERGFALLSYQTIGAQYHFGDEEQGEPRQFRRSLAIDPAQSGQWDMWVEGGWKRIPFAAFNAFLSELEMDVTHEMTKVWQSNADLEEIKIAVNVTPQSATLHDHWGKPHRMDLGDPEKAETRDPFAAMKQGRVYNFLMAPLVFESRTHVETLAAFHAPKARRYLLAFFNPLIKVDLSRLATLLLATLGGASLLLSAFHPSSFAFAAVLLPKFSFQKLRSPHAAKTAVRFRTAA